MGFPGLGSPRSLTPAAGPAHHRDGPDIPLCGLVPPLLLRFGPHLRDAASFAIEWHVHVVATCHELRGSVTPVRTEIRHIDQDVSVRDIAQFLPAVALLFSRCFRLPCAALQSTLSENGRASCFRLFTGIALQTGYALQIGYPLSTSCKTEGSARGTHPSPRSTCVNCWQSPSRRQWMHRHQWLPPRSARRSGSRCRHPRNQRR